MTDTATNESVPAKVLHPTVAFRETMQKMRGDIASALPPQVNPDRFIRTVLTSVNMNPGLLNADRRTLLAACMKSAQTGLFPDGQEAAFVMYGKDVAFLPMVAGLLKMARQSGEIVTVAAHCVHENDEWDYELGDNEFIRHKPRMTGDRGPIVAAYAIGKTKAGGVFREVMSIQDIEKVRAVSRAKNNGPWVQWFERMAEKTVLRRLLKRMPSSTDLDLALEADNENYDLNQGPDVPQPPEVTAPTRLRQSLGVEIGEANDIPSEDQAEDAARREVAE